MNWRVNGILSNMVYIPNSFIQKFENLFSDMGPLEKKKKKKYNIYNIYIYTCSDSQVICQPQNDLEFSQNAILSLFDPPCLHPADTDLHCSSLNADVYFSNSGLRKILKVCGQVPELPDQLPLTENTQLIASVLLNKLYDDLRCDPERDNFRDICDEYIK